MKIVNKIFYAALAIFALSSCQKYLDINKNPNSATAATPDLVLPAAIATTASNLVTYNDYGAWNAGYQVNAGGYSGWGTVLTYNFTSSDNTGLWSSVFLNLKDYQYVINNTEGNSKYILFNAVAKVLKAYNFQLLIDNYGDVPLSNGLTGADNATPIYDSAAVAYKGLILLLDTAANTLRDNANNSDATALTISSDPLFSGNITKWVQFSNTLKLRLLIRAAHSSIADFVAGKFTSFTSEGFLTDDAVANPGYSSSGTQNPFFGTFHSSIAGVLTSTSQSRIPSKFAYTFYNGTKLTDTKRGGLTYYNFPASSNIGQLGDPNNPTYISSHPSWYIGHGTGANAADTLGILKGRSAGVPLFLAAESYFLLAEAALNGHSVSGDAKTNFDKGIVASYTYLEKSSNNTLASGQTPSADILKYQSDNVNNYLANYNLATTDAQRLEAIITQKYIALNFIHSSESWFEFKRTGYPTIVNGSTVPTLSFASLNSESSRADKLPVRLIYPQNEFNLNPNTPKVTSAFQNPVFWDIN